MSVSHQADQFYYEIREAVVDAGITGADLTKANLAYARMRCLITKAKCDESLIPSLHKAIISLPKKLIKAFGVKHHRNIRGAVMSLPNKLKRILDNLFTFKAALTAT